MTDTSIRRPLTLAEKYIALATLAANGIELEDLRSRTLYLVNDIEYEIERKRPGWMIDKMLTGKDSK